MEYVMWLAAIAASIIFGILKIQANPINLAIAAGIELVIIWAYKKGPRCKVNKGGWIEAIRNSPPLIRVSIILGLWLVALLALADIDLSLRLQVWIDSVIGIWFTLMGCFLIKTKN